MSLQKKMAERLFKWAALLFTIIFLGSCSGKEKLFFFCDPYFAETAGYCPGFYSAGGGDIFKELDKIVSERKMRFVPVILGDEKSYCDDIVSGLANGGEKSRAVITSYIFSSDGRIRSYDFKRKIAVVGPFSGLDDKDLFITGNWEDVLRKAGADSALSENKTFYFLPGGQFQKKLFDLFSEGYESYGKKLERYDIKSYDHEISGDIIKKIFGGNDDADAVFSFCRSYGKFVSSQFLPDDCSLLLLNYPSFPVFPVNKNHKGEVSIVCYDFESSFKTILDFLAEDSENIGNGFFYGFDLRAGF